MVLNTVTCAKLTISKYFWGKIVKEKVKKGKLVN